MAIVAMGGCLVSGDVESTDVLKSGNSSYGGNSSGSLKTTKDYKAIVVQTFSLSNRGGSNSNNATVTSPDGTRITSTSTNTSFWGDIPDMGDADCLNVVRVFLNVPSGSTVTYTANANRRTGSAVMGIL